MAAEVVLGLGQSNPGSDRHDRDLSVSADIRSNTLAELGPVGLRAGGGAVADGIDELWVGAGVTAEVPLAGSWFVEGSLMPGYYDFTDGVNTKDDLAMRTRLGLGVRLGTGDAVSLALDNKADSDGDWKSRPERLGIQYHHSFGGY
ncbi:hypothetical protein [Mangrovicoccus algicola]|uniref:Uncharacterized protein n=1 Tax=Mangrovicoccus algicola TaxID=2771008 RepID=A0A8J6Z9T1_9RHOB|nr:hypothetical protein [Mangrovicoccus algicola]MBE3638975.1 hypothetical protein [Mangrovicoccus algicola]